MGGASTEHRLGDLAVERGLITRDQLAFALAEQDRLGETGTRTRLGQILVRQRALKAEDLMQLLKEQDSGPSPVPAVQQKYRVLQELGSGSSGTVYLAEDVKLGRPVALKVLRPDGTAQNTTVRRFFLEGQSLAKLRHPGIVQVFEIGEIGETYFIAMEYIPGETLERLALRGRLGLKETAALLADVCDAVAHAHGAGIVHRDIKPQNIMVEAAGSERRIRVMDFGLAHDVLARTRLTATGAVIGTPVYMAPEQVSGSPVDERTDIYGLGAVLYELITGRAPFSGRNTYELYEAIVEQDVIPPRRLNPRIPADLELVCLTALHKVPAFRYATAAQMATDLRRWIKGEPVTAKPLSLARRLATKARRHKLKIAVAALLLAVASVLGVAWARSARQEREFARLLRDVDGFASSGDFVEGSRRFGEAAVLRPEDERLPPRREALRKLLDAALGSAEAKLRDGAAREASALSGLVLAADPAHAGARACLEKARGVLEAQERAQKEIAERLGLARDLLSECEKAVTLPPAHYNESTLQEKAKVAREALAANLALGETLDTPSRAQTELLAGRLDLYAGRVEQAIEALGRSLTVQEGGAAFYARGEAHLLRYRRERALFGGRDTDLPKVYQARLEELRTAADADFKKAQELGYGAGWERAYLAALIAHSQRKNREALEQLDRLGQAEHVAVWLLRGEILESLGRRADGIKAYETAVDIARSDANALFALADARLDHALDGVGVNEIVAELDRAIATVDIALRLRSGDAHLYVMRGRLRMYRIERMTFLQRFDVDDDLRHAQADYEKALVYEPKDDRAASGLGIILLQAATNHLFREGLQGAAKFIPEFEKAAAALGKAIDLNPWEGYLYKDKGLALAMKGLCLMSCDRDAQPTMDEAFALMKHAEEKDPNSHQTHEAMALAHLWQGTIEGQKLKDMRPHLEAAVKSSTRAIELSNNFAKGRAHAFRSVLRMVLAFYIFFTGRRAEAADLFDQGADDMKKAATVDPMLAMYDPGPVGEFSRALRLQVEGKAVEAKAAFAECERRLGPMAEADPSRGGGSFLARVFARSMRGFCCFYTERWQEAIDEWQALTKQFPPMALMLAGWIAQARKKLKG